MMKVSLSTSTILVLLGMSNSICSALLVFLSLTPPEVMVNANTTFYLSPSGSPSLPCGDMSTPCHSLALAITAARSQSNISIIAASGIYVVPLSATFVGNLSITGSQTEETFFLSSAAGQNLLTLSNGSLSLRNLHFSDFSSSEVMGFGGVFSLSQSRFLVQNCTFRNNSATLGGGAFSCIGPQCYGYVNGSSFLGNSVFISTSSASIANPPAFAGGGAIYCEGTLHLASSLFSSNTATTDPSFPNSNLEMCGGAAFSLLSLEILGSFFDGNSAIAPFSAGGGALCAGNDVTVNDTTFRGSWAVVTVQGTAGGGAIIAINGAAVVEGCTFRSNWAAVQNSGQATGGVISAYTSCSIRACLFENNTALAPSTASSGEAMGGAVFTSQNSVNAILSTFISNSVIVQFSGEAFGGAIYSNSNCSLQMCFFENNTALAPSTMFSGQAFGGAIFTIIEFDATLSVFLSNSVVVQNSGQASGGAISAGTNCFVHFCLFESNAALAPSTDFAGNAIGGAIFAYEQSVYAISSTFFSNLVVVQAAGEANGGAILAQESCFVQLCLFENNTALAPATGFAGDATGGAVCTNFQFVDAISCTFISNSVVIQGQGQAVGGAISANTNCVVHECLFEYNTAFASSADAQGNALGGAVSTGIDFVNAVSSTFVSNAVVVQWSGQATGGAISANTNCILLFCSFTNNTALAPSSMSSGNAYGGAVFTLTQSTSGRYSTFISNSVVVSGSGQANGGAISANTNCSIQWCLFENNTALSSSIDSAGNAAGGAVYANAEAVNVISSTFIFNAVVVQGPGQALGGAICVNADCFMEDCCLFGQLASSARLTKLTVQLGVALGGAVFALNNIHSTNVTLTSNGVISSGAAFGGAIAGGVSTSLMSTSMSFNYALSTLQIGSFGGSACSSSISLVNSSITDSWVSSQASAVGGGIAYCSYLSLTNSSVERCSSSFSGGGLGYSTAFPVSYLMVLVGTAKVIVTNSQLINCTSLRGGAIDMQDTNALISDSVLSGNSVSLQGGAIYIGSSSNVTVVNSVLTDNVASAGGALFWDNTGSLPIIQSSTVSVNNSALYGPDHASFPVRLALLASGCEHITPGCAIFATAAQLDVYDQPIVVPASVLAVAEMTTSLLCSPSVSLLLSGWTNLTLQLFQPVGKLSAQINISVSTTTFVQRNYVYSFPVAVDQYFGFCSVGSVLQPIRAGCLTCQRCPFSTYSLTSTPDNYNCQPCLSSQGQSQCEGNAVYAGTNWWLAVVNGTVWPTPCVSGFCQTNSSLACPSTLSTAACARNFASNANHYMYNDTTIHCQPQQSVLQEGKVSGWCEAINFCAANRTGFMCGDCVSETFSEWSGNCIDCSSPQYGYIVLVLLGYWAEVVVLYMLLSGQASSGTKTLLYFVQVSLLILEPSDPISVALSVFNFRISSSTSVCMFRRTFFEAFIQHVFLVPAVLVVQLLISYGAYTLVMRARGLGSEIDRVRWLVRPLTAIALALYTPITGSVLEMLQCQDVAGYSVISAAPSYVCQGVVHYPYFVIAVILAFVFVAGIPVALAVLMYRYRTLLTVRETQAKLGYWYETYRTNMQWWEITVMVRRTTLTALSISLTGSSRAIAMSVVCMVVATSHHFMEPNSDYISNSLEFVALVILVFLTAMNAGYFNFTGDTQRTVGILQDAVVGVTTLALFATVVYMSRKRLQDGLYAVTSRVRSIIGQPSEKKQDNELELPLLENNRDV